MSSKNKGEVNKEGGMEVRAGEEEEEADKEGQRNREGRKSEDGPHTHTHTPTQWSEVHLQVRGWEWCGVRRDGRGGKAKSFSLTPSPLSSSCCLILLRCDKLNRLASKIFCLQPTYINAFPNIVCVWCVCVCVCVCVFEKAPLNMEVKVQLIHQK